MDYPRSNKLKYMEIYNSIKSNIENGTLAPNEKLPTESELEEHFHVSRITVVKALNLLESNGYIERKQGSGSFIQEIRNNHLDMITLIMPYKVTGREMEYIESIESTLKKNGYILNISISNGDYKKEMIILESILSRIKGVIIYPNRSDENIEFFYSLFNRNIPVVYIDKYPLNIPCSHVISDNYDGGYKIGTYMIEKGYAEFYVIMHDLLMFSTEMERYKGFIKAMWENKVDTEDVETVFVKPNIEDDRIDAIVADITKKAKSTANPIGIFICNDNLAHRIIKSFSLSKDKNCDNIIFAGFDDLEIESSFAPDITIKQFYYEIGKHASELLIQRINEGPFFNKGITVPVELRVKEKL